MFETCSVIASFRQNVLPSVLLLSAVEKHENGGEMSKISSLIINSSFLASLCLCHTGFLWDRNKSDRLNWKVFNFPRRKKFWEGKFSGRSFLFFLILHMTLRIVCRIVSVLHNIYAVWRRNYLAAWLQVQIPLSALFCQHFFKYLLTNSFFSMARNWVSLTSFNVLWVSFFPPKLSGSRGE